VEVTQCTIKVLVIIEIIIETIVMIFVTQTPEMDIEAVVREVEVEIMITIEEGLETMNIVRMTGIER
jgi:hypothetical protein